MPRLHPTLHWPLLLLVCLLLLAAGRGVGVVAVALHPPIVADAVCQAAPPSTVTLGGIVVRSSLDYRQGVGIVQDSCRRVCIIVVS